MSEVHKTYTYDKTNKKGEPVTKTINRTYTKKKDTSKTLFNKENKEGLIKLINSDIKTIKEMNPHKRVSYVCAKCKEELDFEPSYNSLRRLFTKLLVDSESNQQ